MLLCTLRQQFHGLYVGREEQEVSHAKLRAMIFFFTFLQLAGLSVAEGLVQQATFELLYSFGPNALPCWLLVAMLFFFCATSLFGQPRCRS